MSSVAQMLRQAEALKSSVSDSSKTISETWVSRQRLEDIYKKVLLTDLEYALDKKVEQELWNHAFKNQINNLQSQAKDKQNVKRAEVQATLNLFLETASGFYLQFLQLLCTTFKLDLPFRRKSAFYGVMKEKSSMKLKVTPPKKSSCLYVCQHCLVHLGDIARYRQQIDQAQTYYWHAAYLVPFNGQPYNQLAILEAAKGNKLSTVFYYIRSLAVKVPFPVAATNLEKLYAKLTKETPDFKGRLSASEMITGFLQFHALIHLCTDLVKAADLSEKLAAGLPAHVTSQSFPWQVLVHIVAINIFAMNHVQHMPSSDSGVSNGDTELTDDEETCFNLVFTLTVTMLDILLQYTPKQDNRVSEYFTLPAVKLLLDWLKLNPQNFDRSVLKHSPLWGNLCKVLNILQSWQQKYEDDVTKYEDLPLPEDAELRCFQPIEKAHSSYSYSKLPVEGLGTEVEAQLRCNRLLEHGRWIMEEQPGVQLSVQTGTSGCVQFTSPTPPPRPKVTKTVTLSLPSTHIPESNPVSTSAPSPERRPNRHNVAIQAIMQKQAQDKNKPKSIKDEPASPKYLLGVPTSEPVFFKSPGGRQSQSAGGSPQQQSNTGANKPAGPIAQQGGVLVLKNQDHLNTGSNRPGTQPTPKSWGQQRQGSAGSSSWQQPKQNTEKQSWQNSQPSQQLQGQNSQPSPWQQQSTSAPTRPQLSPQTGQGQWQFPGQQNFGRPEFRSRMPLHAGLGAPGMMPTSQPPMRGNFFPVGGPSRPSFNPQQNTSHSQDQFGSPDSSFFNNQAPVNMGGVGSMPMNRPSNSTPANAQQNSPSVDSRFSSPRMGTGEGLGMPFGPGFPTMFRHPPPPGSHQFPPPPNFNTPPPEHSMAGNQNQATNNQSGTSPMGQRSMGGSGLSFAGSGFHGNSFAHAPGTERPQGGRDTGQQPQTPPQMNFQQNQFMNPFQGFMGLPGNHLKSPLEGLFGKPRFSQDDIPPNMADIIGTLSKMAVQPPRENVMPAPRVGPSSFQGHAEGTPKPESFYTSQRSSSVPAVNLDLDMKANEAPAPSSVTHSTHQQHQQHQQQQQQQGTYSLFSGSPWLSSGDSKSIGSSPFSSESSSIRNSPDPSSDTFNADIKSNQVLEMGLRFGSVDERNSKPVDNQPPGPFFQNNVQSIWSSQSQSPLERLLELQKQQRHTEPH